MVLTEVVDNCESILTDSMDSAVFKRDIRIVREGINMGRVCATSFHSLKESFISGTISN